MRPNNYAKHSGYASSAQQTAVPSDWLLDLARSVINEKDRIIAERDREIQALRTALKMVADQYRPEGTVLQ